MFGFRRVLYLTTLIDGTVLGLGVAVGTMPSSSS